MLEIMSVESTLGILFSMVWRDAEFNHCDVWGSEAVKCALQGVDFGFYWFLICYAATKLATPLHQRRIQVVRG